MKTESMIRHVWCVQSFRSPCPSIISIIGSELKCVEIYHTNHRSAWMDWWTPKSTRDWPYRAVKNGFVRIIPENLRFLKVYYFSSIFRTVFYATDTAIICNFRVFQSQCTIFRVILVIWLKTDRILSRVHQNLLRSIRRVNLMHILSDFQIFLGITNCHSGGTWVPVPP